MEWPDYWVAKVKGQGHQTKPHSKSLTNVWF